MKTMSTNFISRKRVEAEAIAFDIKMQKIVGVCAVALLILSGLFGD